MKTVQTLDICIQIDATQKPMVEELLRDALSSIYMEVKEAERVGHPFMGFTSGGPGFALACKSTTSQVEGDASLFSTDATVEAINARHLFPPSRPTIWKRILSGFANRRIQ